MQKGYEEIRTIIIDRIITVLAEVYNETIPEPLPQNFEGWVAFKGDPYLNELHRALERISEGSFGTCMMCKEKIDVPFLRTMPTAHFCSACSEKVHQLAVAEQGAVTARFNR